MAPKKVSDTIAQQRKARQEFLQLKKIQTGEISPDPKPSEIAIVPKTFGEKLKNYWFHYKWHTIIGVFLCILIIFLISECASKPKYDMQVVYFTYTPVMDSQTAMIADYLENFCEDINNDGEVNITVINCSVEENDRTSQYAQSSLIKLQTRIFAEEDAQLYITDSNSINYFKNDELKNFFATEQLKFGSDFYSATASDSFGTLPEGLQIACRKVEGTSMQNNKTAESIQNYALNLLEKLKEKQ